MMKKVFNIFLTLLIISSFFIPTIKPEAKTINDFQKELDKKKAEYNANEKEQTQLNWNKISSKSEIETSRKAINQAEQDLVAAGEKIQQLDREIEQKNEELEELMRALQVSNGSMMYLEYIFGAADTTDFIHRVSIVEELAEYNEQQVKEMEQKIEESKKQQVELKNKQASLNTKIKELEKKIVAYNVRIEDISEIQVDVLDEIKSIQNTINYYKNKGCKVNQDINDCLRNQLPYDTSFWRPVTYGYVSSEYGGRISPTSGKWSMHYGTDIAVGNRVTNLYASAAGKVAVIKNNNTGCGGNYVILHHNIKGTEYSTAYLHMEKVYVKVGQQVTKDTVLGLVGGNPYGHPGYTPWDTCTTGQHVHFVMGRGLKLSTWELDAVSFNSRTLVNYPAIGSGRYFTDRTTKW